MSPAIFILTGAATLILLGLLFGLMALRQHSLERLIFNAFAFLRETPFPIDVLIVVIFPPFLSVLFAWVVLQMNNRDDPFESEKHR